MIPAPFHSIVPDEIDHAKQLLLAALVEASEDMVKGASLRITEHKE